MSSSSTPQQPPSAEQPPRRKPFLQQSQGDMVRSMALLVLLVAAVYGCTQLLASDPEPPVSAVDYSQQLQLAQRQADFEVLSPRDLPSGWRATSVEVEESEQGVSWHLGFLDPADEYVGLEQTRGELEPAVADLVESADSTGSVNAGGRGWDVIETSGDNALVHVEGELVTVVHGSPDVDQLRRFASSLR